MNIPNYKSFACLMAALALSTGAQAAKFSDYELKTAVFWEFNDDSNPDTAVDSVGGVVGTLQGTEDESAMAVYTEDAGGRTGEAGDKAVDFSQAGAGPSIVVDDVDWLNELTAGNRVSISFWQQLTEVTSMTVMKGASPTSSGGERGFSMHTPWSDSTIYFDTAGCCDGATQRVNRNISGLIADYDEIEAFDFTEKWHHFVFIKNGNTKEIWIDGLLFLRGTNTSPLPTDFRQFVMGSSLNGLESMQGFLDDVAFFNGVLVEDEIKQLAGGLKASDLMRDVDSDEDGLPTAYEKAVGLDSDVSNEGVDSDLDGLSDLEEFGLDTNPLLADTDGDGIDDKAEVDAGTNPLSRDTDGDGIDDKSETNTGTFVSATDTGTDPIKADTDGDLWPDGLEIKYNGNALDATIVPLEKGDQNLIAYFNFNSNSPSDAAVDSVFGIEGEFRGRAEDPENGVLATSPVYSAAGEGASGNSGDRAIYFGSGSEQEHLFIEDGSFMSLTAPYDEMTISFWQKLDAIAATFSFFGFSPSANGPNRGVSAHVPWSNASIFFDTSGCCTANTQRVNRDANAFFDQYSEEFPDILNFSFSDWHHYAFIKRGGRKEVYVDGLLFMSSNGALPLPADFTNFFIGAGPNGASSLQGYIDDFAVYASALFPLEVQKLAEGASPTSLDRSRDADNDGMSDILEEIAGLDITRNDAGDDEDKDGVVNSKELENGTDPFDADSDDDGLSDGVESDTGTWVSSSDTGTNPLVADTDGDGLSDGVETNTGGYVSRTDTGTNPLNVDSDNDNFLDGLEVIAKSGPNDSSSTPLVNGQVNLLVYWDFNNPDTETFALDKIRGIEATFVAPQDIPLPYFTTDGGGHTEADGDFGVDLESGTSQGLRIDDAEILNLTGVTDQFTISMWQQLYVLDTNNTFFWAMAPSVGNRGISIQTPWSDGNIYYDTAGCCNGATQRTSVAISADPDNFFLNEWHHFVMVKNGSTKQIWVDGELRIENTNTAPLPTDFTTAYVGVEPSGVNGIQGYVDDLAIYAAALTAEEIALIFNGTAPDQLPMREVIANPEITGVQTNGGNIVIEYTGTLQSGPTINGPWTNVTGSSPYSEAIANGAKFFRVIP